MHREYSYSILFGLPSLLYVVIIRVRLWMGMVFISYFSFCIVRAARAGVVNYNHSRKPYGMCCFLPLVLLNKREKWQVEKRRISVQFFMCFFFLRACACAVEEYVQWIVHTIRVKRCSPRSGNGKCKQTETTLLPMQIFDDQLWLFIFIQTHRLRLVIMSFRSCFQVRYYFSN